LKIEAGEERRLANTNGGLKFNSILAAYISAKNTTAVILTGRGKLKP
jgi:hypothetical protein